MDADLIPEEDIAHNPLDLIEELVVANEWPFQRASEEEIFVEISGQWSAYRLYFVWQADYSALQFGCRLEMRVPDNRMATVTALLAQINERLWLGHFDLSGEEAIASAVIEPIGEA